MLKNLLIVMTCLLAALAFGSHAVAAGILLLIVALKTALIRTEFSHVLEKQLNLLAARLLQILVFLLLGAGLVGLVTKSTFDQTAYFAIALGIAVLPLGIPLILRGKLARSTAKLSQHRAIKMLRSILTANAAQLVLVVLALGGLALFHIAPVVTLPQLLAIDFIALTLPTSVLQFDKKHPKLLQVTTRNLHAHTLSRKALTSYLGYGTPAAVISYAAYLLAFALNHLSPRYIDPSLPLHHQATTLAFTTLVFCLWVAIMFERLDQHEEFFSPYLWENKRLLQAFGLSFVILAAIIYLPGQKILFQTTPLSFGDWLIALALAAIYAGCRLLQRHTRKHSRQTLIKLHREAQKTP